VPVGAFLAAAAMSPDGELGAGMLATGAGVALTSHVIKAGSRALLNTSPEPVSNWTASVTEDAAVVGGLALAFTHPWLALAIVVAISLLFAFFVWWLWRRLFRRAPRPDSPLERPGTMAASQRFFPRQNRSIGCRLQGHLAGGSP
jgi:Kef-type K+ transport system membrane component KefB